jgi:hypothetical protein
MSTPPYLNEAVLARTIKFIDDTSIGVSQSRRAALILGRYGEELTLTCDVQLPGLLLRKGCKLNTLLLALERRRLWDDEATTLRRDNSDHEQPAEGTDPAADNQCIEEGEGADV